MTRWLQLDDKLINLDKVACVEPHQIKAKDAEPIMGAWVSLGHPDCYVVTQRSVEEVFHLIECAEGPKPPRALITDHDFNGVLGAMYECSVCFLSKGAHAK